MVHWATISLAGNRISLLHLQNYDNNNKRIIYCRRYFEAFRSPEYGDIDLSLQRETFDWFHQFRNMYVASDSWFSVSCANYLEYWDCKGDLLLNWKDKGYCNVLNLLQVSAIFLNYIIFSNSIPHF